MQTWKFHGDPRLQMGVYIVDVQVLSWGNYSLNMVVKASRAYTPLPKILAR
jgi:hypothetical protein